MANLEWFPINPLLDEKGAFYSLANEKEAKDALKPVALTAGDNPFSQSEVIQRSISTNMAAELGILTSNTSGSYNSFCFSYEAMLFTDKIVSTPIAGKIYGTRWGAGLRVVLNVSDLKGEAQLKFGAIAASAELGLAKVEYRINTIGFNDPAILKLFPDPGEFNFATYSKIIEASASVKKYMAENIDKLQAQPFQVYMSSEYKNNDFDKARAVIYAANQLKNRNSLFKAITSAQGKYDVGLIRGFYQMMGILDERYEPSRNDKRKAEQFLSS